MQTNLIVVQCRYNSRRLPGKALYPLCGVPMLVFLLKRLLCELPGKQYKIVLAIPENEEDDILAIWGKKTGIEIVRGESNDVLRRYLKCLQRYPSSKVVRVTADNPLTCPTILKACITAMDTYKADYVQSKGCPLGTGVDVFTADVLRTMDKEAINLYDREHINAFVLNHLERFNLHFFNVQGEIARPDLSMTVDTKYDWEIVDALFSNEDNEPWRIPLDEAIKRMDTSITS